MEYGRQMSVPSCYNDTVNAARYLTNKKQQALQAMSLSACVQARMHAHVHTSTYTHTQAHKSAHTGAAPHLAQLGQAVRGSQSAQRLGQRLQHCVHTRLVHLCGRQQRCQRVQKL